jgi:hypothetical protein
VTCRCCSDSEVGVDISFAGERIVLGLVLAARMITTSGSHLGLFKGEGVICLAFGFDLGVDLADLGANFLDGVPVTEDEDWGGVCNCTIGGDMFLLDFDLDLATGGRLREDFRGLLRLRGTGGGVPELGSSMTPSPSSRLSGSRLIEWTIDPSS